MVAGGGILLRVCRMERFYGFLVVSRDGALLEVSEVGDMWRHEAPHKNHQNSWVFPADFSGHTCAMLFAQHFFHRPTSLTHSPRPAGARGRAGRPAAGPPGAPKRAKTIYLRVGKCNLDLMFDMAAIAQLAARRSHNPKVVSSIFTRRMLETGFLKTSLHDVLPRTPRHSQTLPKTPPPDTSRALPRHFPKYFHALTKHFQHTFHTLLTHFLYTFHTLLTPFLWSTTRSQPLE